MANVHTQIQSFNAGELSPLLGARFAVEKVQSGCRRLRNFLLHVHGPVFRRPGMEHMGAAAGSGSKSRLLPFNFSTTTGAILELHPSGLRVWQNGLLVPLRTPIDLPYTESECAEVQMVQVNDVCYLSHGNHAPLKLTRFSDTDWRIAEIPWKWPALDDENVRNDEIAAPSTTTLFSSDTYEWPEFEGIPAGSITFSVVNPDGSSARKIAKLQRLVGNTWKTVKSFSWTTAPPAPWGTSFANDETFRMTWDGPTVPTSALQLDWLGGIAGTVTLDLSIPQPQSSQPVTVPPGDWQAIVTSPLSIPAKVSVELQQLNSRNKWVSLNKFKLLPGRGAVYKGAKLKAAITVRFVWTGRQMDEGTMAIEQPVFPVTTDITLTVSDVSGTGRTLTASVPIFLPEHVGSFWQITHNRERPWAAILAPVPTIIADTSNAIRVQGKWQVTTYGIWNCALFLEKEINDSWVTVRSWSANKDRNIVADGEEDSAVNMRLRIAAGNSTASGEESLPPRFVLEALDAEVNGLVKITDVGAVVADGKASTATVDVTSPLFSTDPTAIWTEGAWSAVKGYPRCVALHEGRLWWGGTRTEPMRLWGSVVNDYENFQRSSLDDAGVSFTPAAQSANSLQWMLSHEREMVIGTAGDEWTMGTDQGPITPTNVLMQRRSNYGSQPASAVLVNESMIFVQRGGRKLRQIVPQTDSVSWSASDMTVLAEHLAQAGISQLAMMSNPFSILWAISGDGKLLGMTYEAEQNVFGWHVHETAGTVESVAVVRGTDVDEVWLQTLRNGVRYIERLDPLVLKREFEIREQLIYLDAAVRVVAQVAQSSVAGLQHLEGQQVGVLADGVELAPRRVINGAIALDAPASVVVVGLPYVSELQPMRIEVPLRDGTSQGRKFRLSRVVLSLHESGGGEVADGIDGRPEKLNYRRTVDAMDAVPPLFTGDLETALTSKTRDGIDVIVRQSSPLPLNVGAIVLKADVFGE